MIGGYFSFQGIDGKARWGRTAVEEALPVTCLPNDDRLEIPEGFKAVIQGPANHPILQGLDTDWPLLLGANEVMLKAGPDIEVLASLPADQGGHPLLVTGRFGEGRTAVWTSDIGPHWLPQTFVDWPGYATLWINLLAVGHGPVSQPSPASADAPPLVSVRGLSKRFGALTALRDVDLDIRAGEVLALLGDNGAGKSTFIKILAGAHPPSDGEIAIAGTPVTFASPQDAADAGIATIFQELAL